MQLSVIRVGKRTEEHKCFRYEIPKKEALCSILVVTKLLLNPSQRGGGVLQSI